MSYKLADAAINADIGDAIAKLVLIALARYANDQGACFPSIATIAKTTHLHTATVCRKLNWLEQQGMIKRDNRSGVSTRYLLLIAQCDTLVAESDTKQSISSNKHSIPDDWIASASLRQSINEVLDKEIDHDHEEARFRDYYLADGKQVANWEPAYRNWCRNKQCRVIDGAGNASTPNPKRHGSRSSFFAEAAGLIAGTKH